MKQENKDLLFKDLSARLPYGVKLYCRSNVMTCIGPYTLDTIILDRTFNEDTEYVPFDEVKPYLFPMSSMTEEQKKYISDRWGINDEFDFEIDPNWGEYFVDLCDAVDYINWLNENHFDYRGLIPKGLAIDVTDKNIY